MRNAVDTNTEKVLARVVLKGLRKGDQQADRKTTASRIITDENHDTAR